MAVVGVHDVRELTCELPNGDKDIEGGDDGGAMAAAEELCPDSDDGDE